MKKYTITLNIQFRFIVLAVFLGSGCSEDFLTVTPNHYITEADFFQTDDDFIQATNGVYGDLQTFTLSAHILQEGRSDNTTYDNALDQGALGGAAQLGFLDQFNETSDSNSISGPWNQIYNAIKDCNFPLSYLETATIDPDLARRIEGELRFFRAYFHFIAVQYWGDVPLLLEPITTAEQAFAIERTPISEVYQAIIADVQFAISSLEPSYTGGNKGRVTSYAAKMLLAKVYMTSTDYRDYGLAQQELEDIVNSGLFEIIPSYADLFDPAMKNSKESIFEVQYLDGTAGEASNFIYQFAPFGSRGTVFLGPGNGGGRNIPTLDMINTYEVNDLRKDVSIGYFDRGTLSVPYAKKYDNDVDPDFATTPDNWPIYRYADVLLLLAEAINEQAYNPGLPFTYLNEIRSRANLPDLTTTDLPNQDAFRTAIAHERRVELAFENHRWFDLLRTGKAIEVMSAYGQVELANPTTPPPNFLPFDENSWVITPNKLLYQLPSEELNLAPFIQQNPTD
ncbi:RagB/SusD family nutrient uptake outer membrane protein [Cyclobacterium salsum]|uniref:RagB/SusD family nutrient uptake outer membrane protein n=1 Tax=Cyclobacterium salsum TaxID=2666329 RepID=UPI001391EFB3|nr:RagB/SusD family nutrient uptake outer membrane protein [Cyclobacterium salsum]